MDGSENPPPAEWTADRACYSTVIMPPVPYHANDFGGALRRLPLCAADASNDRQAPACTQTHAPRKKLAPGIMVRRCPMVLLAGTAGDRTAMRHARQASSHFWRRAQVMSCAGCGRIVNLSMMSDAESPQTVWAIAASQLPEGPKVMVYDNGCNLSLYIYNRDPGMMRDLRIYIDRLHFRGHKRCLDYYDTGALPATGARAAHGCKPAGVHVSQRAMSVQAARGTAPTPCSRTRRAQSARTSCSITCAQPRRR